MQDTQGAGAAEVRRTRPHGKVRSPLVSEVVRRIRHEFAGPLTLKNVAASLGRQTEYLGTLFRQQAGVTFHQRLTTVRMRQAARLIRAGEKIEAVVLLVGYRSKKNFYAHFRRRFGMTPGAYRDRHLGAPPPASGQAGVASHAG